MGNAVRGRSSVGNRSTGLIDSQAVRAGGLYFSNNKSVQFAQTGDDIITTNAVEDFGLTITNQITVSQWSRDVLTARSFHFLYGSQSSGSLTDGFGAYWTTNTLIAFWGPYNGSSRVNWVAPDDDYIKEWHHYVFVYDGDLGSERVKLYVDGVEEITALGTDTNLTAGSTKLKIGSTNSNAVYDMEGNIDEFAIWNIPLTQEEVTALYNDGKSNKDATQIQGSNLTLYYRMGDPPDTTGTDGITDRSGNENHGTLEAGAVIVDEHAPTG